MFGDYFKSLSTIQKIMFGVAVFLAVAVIVYLIYKYLFKVAKNFIQHYIMPSKEKFEAIRLVLKSKCNNWEFYGSTSPSISTLSNVTLNCTRIPDRCVRSGEINWGTNKGDGLKFVLSYKGTCRFSANIQAPTDPANNSNPEHFLEMPPAANNAVIPVLSSQPTDNRYVALNSIISSSSSRTDTGIENDATATYRNSSIVLQSALGVLSTLTVADSAKDRKPESADEVLSIYCKNVNGSPLVTRLNNNSFTGVTANHGIFYHVEQTTPTFNDSKLRGKHTYYMPIRMINFLRPNNNRTPGTTSTDFGYNSVSTSGFDNRNLLNPATFSQNNYTDPVQNCIDYITNFKNQNRNYLIALSAQLLRTCGLYSSVVVDNLGDNNFVNNTRVLQGADFNIVSVNNIYYLRVSNVDYECGDGRIDVASFCNGTGPAASITQTLQYSQPINVSRNLVDTNIFRETCALAPYTVTGGPGSCTGTNCMLTGAKFNYEGITPIFNLATGTTNLFKSFSPGQSVILPVNLISIGTTDPSTQEPTAPTWYQQVNQYELDVFSQASNLARQQCNAPDVFVSGIRAMPGQSNYSFDSATDEVSWTTGSSKVYVTRRIKASYHVNNPLLWQLYYIDNNGQPKQYGSESGQVISSSQPTQVSSPLFIIGAPINNNVTNNDRGVPSFVPVFVGSQNTSVSTAYEPSSAERTQMISIERNIWVGLMKQKVYNAANKTFTQMSGQQYNFGDLIRAFFYLTTGQWSASVTDYSLLSAVGLTQMDNLLWGVALSPNQQPSVEGLKLYNYNTFPSLSLPSSATFNSRSITHGGNNVLYIDTNNVLRRIQNGASLLGTPSTLVATQTSILSGETLIIYKSFPNGLGGILVTRTSTNRFKIYPVSATSTTLVVNASINEQVIPIVDLDVTNNNNFIAVASDDNAQNTNIIYGSFASPNWTVRSLNIINRDTSFANDLFLFSSVRFCNKVTNNVSVNPNVIISTRLFTVANRISGYLYNGVVSSDGITLTKILATNYNIRSIACSDDATISARPNIITIAVYNGPVICLNNSSQLYTERSVSAAIGKWVGVDITSDGQYQVACSEFSSTPTQDLTSSDGRVLYADNFAATRDDWRIIPNPKKYNTDLESSNAFNPTSASFDKFFNAYNYNSVDIIREGDSNFITLNFSVARTYSGSKVTSTNETTVGNGILSIRLS